MEKVYDPANFSCTEPLDLEKYFKEFHLECNLDKSPSDDMLKCRQKILHEDFQLPFALEDIADLEALCTIAKLKVPKENPKLPLNERPKSNLVPETHPITEEARTLHTLRAKQEFNNWKSDLWDLKEFQIIVNEKNEEDLQKDIAPGCNYVYKILIYTPFNTMSGNRLTVDSVRKQYEVEVLSTNTLLDLANSIKCISDSFTSKEVPDMTTDFSNFINVKEEYPSRCFFIENVFYNDMSHPNSIDYSEVIRKWAIEKEIGEFGSQSMKEAMLKYLKPRLGYPYVYIHQGNCEHIMCFSDVRLIQSCDCLDSRKYPRITSLKRHNNHICFICSKGHASWMVTDSDRLPVRRAFFCSNCCQSYMFSGGKKIGKFALYPYYTGALAGGNQEQRYHYENGCDSMEDN